MKKMIVIPVVLLLVNQFIACAQPDDKSRQKDFTAAFSSYIQKMREKIPDMPAVAVVVVKNDQPIFLQAYGVANKETGAPADINTLFYIASSTKSFTALAAALLDKEGIIKLSDPVTKYTTGISFKTPIPDRITVRDLLTHTSGIKNEPLTFRMAYSGQVATKDILNVFAGATNVIDSNYGKYGYDNLGYNIYAVLLQHHTGKKWQDVLQQKIFDPLQMKHTTAYISKAVSGKWPIALPYLYAGDKGSTVRSWLDKTDNNMQSAGGVFASIADVGTWLNMNMNNGKLNGKQVMPADIMQKVHTGYTNTIRDQQPFTGNGAYGLGWQIGKYKTENVIYHHGGFPGYRSHISFMPDKKVAVAVLTNDGTIGGTAVHMLATYAYDWWMQTPGMQETFDRQLQDMTDNFEKGKMSMKAGAADRSKRTSQLTLAPDHYTGTYNHQYFGTVEVTNKDNTLAVKLGEMYYVSTPFTQKETIRVELIPGSGEVIRFKLNDAGKIESLNYAGIEFQKVK